MGSKSLHDLKIKFVAKLGLMGKYDDGEEKYHVIIPKQHVKEIKNLNLKGKQIKITMEDEL